MRVRVPKAPASSRLLDKASPAPSSSPARRHCAMTLHADTGSSMTVVWSRQHHRHAPSFHRALERLPAHLTVATHSAFRVYVKALKISKLGAKAASCSVPENCRTASAPLWCDRMHLHVPQLAPGRCRWHRLSSSGDLPAGC